MEEHNSRQPGVDWTAVTKQFESIPVGALCKGNNNSYYLKPAQSKAHHLDGMLINLFTGSIVHYSNTYGLHQVYGSIIFGKKGD